MVGVVSVKPGDQAILITSSGKLIRIPVDDVSAIGRSTQGVRMIRVEAEEQVVAVAKVIPEDEDENAPTPESTAAVQRAALEEGAKPAETSDEDDEDDF